jgi:hypothetical protein
MAEPVQDILGHGHDLALPNWRYTGHYEVVTDRPGPSLIFTIVPLDEKERMATLLTKATETAACLGFMMVGVHASVLAMDPDVILFAEVTPATIKDWIPIIEMAIVTIGSALFATASKWSGYRTEKAKGMAEAEKAGMKPFIDSVEQKLSKQDMAVLELGADVKAMKEMLSEARVASEKAKLRPADADHAG